MPHFTPHVWQSGPSAAHPAALNSPDAPVVSLGGE